MNRLCLAVALTAFVNGAAHATDQTLKLAVGQQAPIELEENPSTGYRWAIDAQASSNLSILHIDDRGFSHSVGDKPLLGAPGVHRWNVHATSPGNASITFVYRRPWEPSVARRHQVEVEATVR
jgi:inhibitor of cysteine peptidase